MSEAVMREMIKFFDAVSGGTGPYGWIYAMEHEKYGIECARFFTHTSEYRKEVHHLSLKVRGKKVLIYYDYVAELFRIDNFFTSVLYKCFEGKTLSELFDHLSSNGH